MRSWLPLLLFILLGSFVQAKPALPAPVPKPAPSVALSTVKSFRDWKAEKVQAATQQVDRSRLAVKNLKAQGRGGASLENAQQELSQDEWNLEVAGDLSVTDYLALYLAQNSGGTKLTEAAGKLSADEIAQVLEAYIHSMGTFAADSRVNLPIHALQGR